MVSIILDLLPTETSGLFDGVPKNTPRGVDPFIKHPSILIAYSQEDLLRCLKKYREGVLAIVLMTNDGPKAWAQLESEALPIIIGQQLRLPEGFTYFIDQEGGQEKKPPVPIPVHIHNRSSIWGESQIILRGSDVLLTAQFVNKGAPFKVPIPSNIHIDDVKKDLDIRRQLLGFLCMPRGVLISESNIVINPK